MRPYRAPMCSMVHTQRISGYFAESAVSGKVKRFSMSFNSCACPESSSLTAALCSAVAEFVCTTLEIWSIPCVTCSMRRLALRRIRYILEHISNLLCFFYHAFHKFRCRFHAFRSLFNSCERGPQSTRLWSWKPQRFSQPGCAPRPQPPQSLFRPVRHGRPLQLHSGPVYWSEMRYPQWF